MKIAILLTGISYKKEGYRDRDWKLTCDNIKENIIDCWIGYEVNTYITTYDNNNNMELLDFYKPKKFNIINYEDSDQLSTYIKSLELLLDEDVDFIVSTRFDIHFKLKLCNLYIKFDKFNFLFKENIFHQFDKFAKPDEDFTKKINFVGDGLFMFPKTHLNNLISAVKLEEKSHITKNGRHLHNIYNRLSDLSNGDINIISSISENTHDNSFYKLVRV